MIEFRSRRVDKSGTPILSDAEIDVFAHDVLRDYKPDLLREPGKIRFDHFLESYLEVGLEFHDIYNENPNHQILGATAFQDERLRVFDRERMRVASIPVAAWTVIIDNSVMRPGKEGLALFTGLHESGHIMLHSGVYANGCADQLSLFEDAPLPLVTCYYGNNELSPATERQGITRFCDFDFAPRGAESNREFIENFAASATRKRSPAEWREHHADYFAAALAMPNATFKPAVNQLLRENDIWKGKIITGIDEDLDYLAKYFLPEQISEIYGVSKRAAFVKLCKTGFVIDKETHRQRELQVSFY